MCNPLAAVAGVKTGIDLYNAYSTQKNQAYAAQRDMDMKKKAAVQNLGYMFQNYEAERRDAFDVAVGELDSLYRNSNDLNASVEAATNEAGEGRTLNMINRAVHGDTADTAMSIKDNYARKSNEVDLNKETAWRQTNDYIAGLNASAPKMPSRFSNFLNAAGIILSNFTDYMDEYQREKLAGAFSKKNPGGNASANAGLSIGSSDKWSSYANASINDDFITKKLGNPVAAIGSSRNYRSDLMPYVPYGTYNSPLLNKISNSSKRKMKISYRGRK